MGYKCKNMHILPLPTGLSIINCFIILPLIMAEVLNFKTNAELNG
jgi:hypothetical protein